MHRVSSSRLHICSAHKEKLKSSNPLQKHEEQFCVTIYPDKHKDV